MLAPPARRAQTRARQARHRARQRDGVRIYRLPLRDNWVEGLITQMVLTGRLSESQAFNHQRVEAELAKLLEEQGERWSR